MPNQALAPHVNACLEGRGLGRPTATSSLRTLVRKHAPDCVFISEIKVKREQLQPTLTNLGYQQSYFHPPREKSGGLCLALKQGLDVEVTTICENCINVIVYSCPVNLPWMATFIYGPPAKHQNEVLERDN